MENQILAEKINGQSPAAFLKPAKKRGWLCPVCGNGSGKDGDGIVRNPKTGRYKCFKCGLGGDILDLVGAAFGLDDFPARLKKAAEIYGYRTGGGTAPAAAKKPEGTAEQPAAEDCTAYLAKCREAVSRTDFFARRGISAEVVRRFGLGFDPDFSEGTGGRHWQAAILPTSPSTYEARNTQVAPNDPQQGKNKYRKHGAAVLFNRAALAEETEQPIFVCEGILDALSVIECGGQAVGLGSAVNYPLLLKELETVSPAVPLVLFLDEDETGRKNGGILGGLLEGRKVPCLCPKTPSEGFHDANAWLLGNAAGLKAFLAAVKAEAAALPAPREQQKQAYLSTSAAAALPAFLDSIRAGAARPRYSTGFAELDRVLGGGLFPGLYVLGAISSLGKTTLTLQLADCLAQQGQDVLFFSLEQSRFDLMSKSVSRESWLWCRQNGQPERCAHTGRNVLDGRRWDDFSRYERQAMDGALARYRQYAGHLFFYEGIGSISVEDIRQKVKDHIAFTGNRFPVVCIDYLQILKPAEGDERATDKQAVDRNVTALKQLSRDFDISVVAVSSLNRASYAERVNMAAFKESGAIEYGSDVLLGLQLSGVGEAGFEAGAAKEKTPREVDLCVLKNRSGKTAEQGIPLRYDPRFNVFYEEDFIEADIPD